MKNTEHENLVEFQVSGDYALFSDPIMRVGGENALIRCRPTKRSRAF